MKLIKAFLWVLLMAGSFSCQFRSVKKIRIGFSQCVGNDQWRQAMFDEMQRELSFNEHVELIYRDADNSSTRQISQILDLIKQDIDLLIVSPNEAQPLTATIEMVYNYGIPVIVIDRKIASTKYTAYIGGDNYGIGQRVGEYAANYLKGKGHILEITGLPGSSPAIERNRGFTDALAAYKGITVSKTAGNWLKDTAIRALKQIPAAELAQVDLVFSHNEVMALGAHDYFASLGLAKHASFIGVDGLPNLGLKYVSNKTFTATALYPTGGEEAIRTAMAVLHHKSFVKENILQTVIIDSSNVRIMAMQSAKINNQQQEITRQQRMIDNQRRIYAHQNTTLYIILAFLIISIILGAFALYLLRQKKITNRQLIAQNAEITRQQQELIRMAEQAQAANEAKLQFFTNISHEFRTPLTLILAPLEDLLHNGKMHFSEKQSLKLVQKNVIRLLRLINQLMDFRKIELDKLKLQATQNNIVHFVQDIMDTFQVLADKRNIDFRLITKEKQLDLWFDVNMLDKVLFNLLSNAFKFTNDNGLIHVYLARNVLQNTVTIKVEDNGVGMHPEAVDHAFELFYNSEITSQQGSGLGLSLSKELITLHHGSIAVTSTKWKGTSFEIILPLGEEHLRDNEKIVVQDTGRPGYNEEKIFLTELDESPAVVSENGVLQQPADRQSILIIEDNDDLRNFLTAKLKADYDVISAGNGANGLQLAYNDIPDLVISDIVLPDKDGLQVTTQLKSDIRTSHIPVILLTSKTTMENQVEGMQAMADAYVVKPFNLGFLHETIRSILKNRNVLREHYTSELQVDKASRSPRRLDRKFINEFTAIVESNIGNEQFSAEEICKTMGISRVQLYRKVKALLGVHVSDYIISVRLQKAKYYLGQKELTIAEIAFKVGFSSAAYFSTVFKSKFSCTPKEFREGSKL